MRLVLPKAEIILDDKAINILKKIERCGRLCYQSEHRITSDSYIKFIKGLIARGHLSVIEHGSATAIVVCDRGVSHEIVRHRLGSYSQESTRYCNYLKSGINYIQPDFILTKEDKKIMQLIEDHYNKRLSEGLRPEQARGFLLTLTKTEIAITYNFREWTHFFQVRGAKDAHPQIREVAKIILTKMKEVIPIVFDDIVI